MNKTKWDHFLSIVSDEDLVALANLTYRAYVKQGRPPTMAHLVDDIDREQIRRRNEAKKRWRVG
jgi:hypothetical protein